MIPGHAEYLRDKVRRYGITVFDYLALREAQEYRCAICLTDERNLVIDHCHISGIVRGLLCNRCNVALGWFNDEITLLVTAIEYLKEKGSQ